MRKIQLLSIILLSFVSIGNAQVSQGDTLYTDLQVMVDSVRMKYAPDKRVAIFDITITSLNGKPILKGVTTEPLACEELLTKARAKYPLLVDSLSFLPEPDLGDKVYGVINVSVADMRVKPDFEFEMATQSLLGMPIRILQSNGRWSRVQTPDGYISWVQNVAFQSMNRAELDKWNNLADKIVFTDYFGFSFREASDRSQHVSDLVAGNMLNRIGEEGDYYKVLYPDGREAFVSKLQSKTYSQWISGIKLTPESMIDYATSLMGIPYVWGGTSTKGMDCSGFTKTVLFMHGVLLMRDASQQVYTGIPVDISSGYGNLKVGDLMFFGKKGENGRKDRIRHVAFYLGNNEFIHASGYVRINSLDPLQPHYDEKNTTEFIRASRILGAVGTQGIWNISENPFYKIHIEP